MSVFRVAVMLPRLRTYEVRSSIWHETDHCSRHSHSLAPRHRVRHTRRAPCPRPARRSHRRLTLPRRGMDSGTLGSGAVRLGLGSRLLALRQVTVSAAVMASGRLHPRGELHLQDTVTGAP